LEKKLKRNIAEKGSKWLIENGFGFEEDLLHTESEGYLKEANPDKVSDNAFFRGKKQLGTIGSGNHFVEIGKIQKILHPEIAKLWNLEKNHTYIMIHSGSRGFGHQICQDTLTTFLKQGFDKNLPDTQLLAAPILSTYGKDYFEAMSLAANFAFCNRQMILNAVREAFKKVLNISKENIPLLYDVCHNIAKFENHTIDKKEKEVLIHRKGATRAFEKNHRELSPLFKQTGQPVIVPGDMGRASYILVGLGNPLTYKSCCHGAGRHQSRHQSLKAWKEKNPLEYMEKQGVSVMATSKRTILEEMPDAYKNVDVVVEAVEKAHLAKSVARLKPKLVIKG